RLREWQDYRAVDLQGVAPQAAGARPRTLYRPSNGDRELLDCASERIELVRCGGAAGLFPRRGRLWHRRGFLNRRRVLSWSGSTPVGFWPYRGPFQWQGALPLRSLRLPDDDRFSEGHSGP